MKRLVFKNPYPNSEPKVLFADDIQRLRVVAATEGAQLDEDTAVRVWAYYSENYAASWMTMHGYSDADLWAIIEQHTTAVYE